ncbi:FhaA domain-containing protein [Patulibacter minatonensis]|uniref:FhaA domain-containing protein n=1 Tax=Patulibacter minatonensis TaxID=298163 RepID=UPI0004798E26|nr:DUF3662 and FHA domain-containing protein [Patulibacter minatonensis]
MLRDIESKLAGLVEGTFGRMFRSEVTPAELARGLAREMEATRRQGLDRTWVAHHYDVFLSPADHQRISSGAAQLADELAASLVVHAREQRFALPHAPEIVFHLGPELPTSRYGIRAQHDEGPSARAAEPDRARAPERRPSNTGGAPPVPRRREPVDAPAPRPRPREGARRAGPSPIALVLDGRIEPVPSAGGTVGRSRDCDVVISSAEVSRQHMELRPRGDGWVVFDLGSTNGVRVNGRQVGGTGDPGEVRPGDRIDLGTVSMTVRDAP